MAGESSDPLSASSRDAWIEAADGARLAATDYRGADDPIGVIVVQGATAVLRRFYGRIASYLARQGFLVVTFDYRGIGDSLHGPLRDSEATMMDWAKLDTPAARRHAWSLAPELPRFVLAHSFGGQALAIEPPSEPLSGAVMVGCQEGDLRLWPWMRIPWFLAGVGVIIPLCGHLVGYVPRWAGFGEGMPAGVALEWARWCRSREYVFGIHPELAQRGAEVRNPILALTFEDDHYAPPRAAGALLSRFPNAEVDHRHRHPRELGFPAISHFGYFRSSHARLWETPAEWLRERARHGRTDAVASPRRVPAA